MKGRQPMSDYGYPEGIYGRNNDQICPPIIESRTVTEVRFRPDDIVVFLDEAGNVQKSSGNPYFFFCGVAVIGWDYHTVRADWNDLRRSIFGQGENHHFHSSRHVRKLYLSGSASGQETLQSFLRNAKIAKLIAWETHGFPTNQTGLADIKSIVTGLVFQIHRYFGRERRQIWYIEHSSALPWRLVTDYLFSDRRERIADHFFFIEKKKTIEAGLDLADLIAFIWSQHVLSGSLFGTPKPAYRYAPLLEPGLTTYPELLRG